MATRAERRAALAGAADPTPTQGPPPMKIRFASVHLEIIIPRSDGGKNGLASSDTSYFTAGAGCTIELDQATGLVRLANGGAEAFVPLARVQRFGPVLQPEAAKPDPTAATSA